jgi:hypothetical protein
MAGNLPVPNGVEMKLVWGLNGVPTALNILHFTNSSGTAMTQARADGVGVIVRAALGTSLLPAQLSSLVSLMRTELRSMTAGTDPWFIAAGAAVPGTSTEAPLPAATALVVTLKTGLRGRSYNGRYYQWGYSEVANDAAGGSTGPAGDAAGGFINLVRNNLLGAPSSLAMGILSRFTTPPGAAAAIERTPPVITPVTSEVLLDRRWDTQRRRAVPGI